MIKRTLLFSNPYHLSTTNQQLKAIDKSTKVEKSVPIEDLSFVIFEHPQITFSQKLMQKFADYNVAVVFCNEKFLPASLLLNLDGNQLQTARFRAQVAASEPLKKNLWMQTVKAKIRNQAGVLESIQVDAEAVRYKAKKVKSGDPSNEEAKAAAIYWKRLMGSDFRRERYGIPPNNLLNYGYAVLRAATARALAGSGLHPTFGIHHHNQYNSFCLADDIMEPYRPYVDCLVIDYLEENDMEEELSQAAKAHLLGVLSMDTKMDKRKRPLTLALAETTASLAQCFEGKLKNLKYPTLL